MDILNNDQLINILALNFSELILLESSFNVLESDLIEAELPLKVSVAYGDIEEQKNEKDELRISVPASISFKVFKDEYSLDKGSMFLSSEYTYSINITVPSMEKSISETDRKLFEAARNHIKDDFDSYKEAITPLLWKNAAAIFNINLTSSKVDLESLPMTFPKSQLNRVK